MTDVLASPSNQTGLSGIATIAAGVGDQLSSRAVRFFEGRGISAETAVNCGVYTYKHGETGEAIAFGYFEDGSEVNTKYRGPDKRFWQREGGKKTFWNADILADPSLVSGENALVITEGEMDALAVIEAGYPFVVSVPDGAPPAGPADGHVDPENDAKYEYVWNCWDRLSGIKKIIVAADSDGPGKRLYQELTRRLGVERCAHIQYPDGCKDFGDVMAREGAACITSIIADAKPAPIKGLYKLSEYPDMPEPEFFSTGWVDFDARLKVWTPAFMVVTGIPTHGKSAWVTALVCNLIKTHGWHAAIGTFEMQVAPHYRDLLRRYHAGAATPYQSARDKVEADAWIEKHLAFISHAPTADDDEDLSLGDIIELAEMSVVRHGTRVLVLDPWNEIEHKRRRDETGTEYINRAIRELKRFAMRRNCLVIVVAHPTKMNGNKDGTINKPTLYDVDGSAAWYNKADIGVVVWRDSIDGTLAEINVSKIKLQPGGGKPCATDFVFYRDSGRYDVVLDGGGQ